MKSRNTTQKSILFLFILSSIGCWCQAQNSTITSGSNVLNFTSVDFGNITPGKTAELKAGSDYDVEGFGRMFCHHVASDEGRFVYAKFNGDFDMVVRVESIHNDTAALSEVGLMARKSLDPASVLMSMAVTNNEYRSEGWPYTFMYRIESGGFGYPKNDISRNGAHGEKTYGNAVFGCSDINYIHGDMSLIPRPLPNVWLRLTKVGDRYTGYRRENNDDWVKLGDYTLNMGEELYIGLFISANHHGGTPKHKTIAKFRELSIK